MKLMSYKKLIKQSKEKIDDMLAPIRANQAKKLCELEIAKMEETIATLESDVQQLCTMHPLKIHDVISKQDELALVERKKKQLEKIIKELFESED